MKRITVGLCAVLAFGLFASARADEAKRAQAEKDFKSFADHLIGGVWEETNAAVEGSHEYRPFGNGRFIQHVATRDGQRVDELEIVGVDLESDEVTVWGFSALGTLSFPLTKQGDGTWGCDVNFVDRQGQRTRWKGTFAQGKDELRIKGTMWIDGQDVTGPDSTGVWRRLKGTIDEGLAVNATDDFAAKSDTEKAFKEFADLLTSGVWKVTVQNGDGTEDRVREYRWVGGKRFLLRIDTVAGKRQDRVLVLGVDSKVDEVKFWRFSETGVLSEIITKGADGSWTTGGTFTNAEDKRIEWTRKTTIMKDGLRRDSTLTVDGTTAQTPTPLIWKRTTK